VFWTKMIFLHLLDQIDNGPKWHIAIKFLPSAPLWLLSSKKYILYSSFFLTTLSFTRHLPPSSFYMVYKRVEWVSARNFFFLPFFLLFSWTTIKFVFYASAKIINNMQCDNTEKKKRMNNDDGEGKTQNFLAGPQNTFHIAKNFCVFVLSEMRKIWKNNIVRSSTEWRIKEEEEEEEL
jgi:hypothetical protein